MSRPGVCPEANLQWAPGEAAGRDRLAALGHASLPQVKGREEGVAMVAMMIGIDPHKASYTAVAIDPAEHADQPPAPPASLHPGQHCAVCNSNVRQSRKHAGLLDGQGFGTQTLTRGHPPDRF
jgi:hypothetical protein